MKSPKDLIMSNSHKLFYSRKRVILRKHVHRWEKLVKTWFFLLCYDMLLTCNDWQSILSSIKIIITFLYFIFSLIQHLKEWLWYEIWIHYMISRINRLIIVFSINNKINSLISCTNNFDWIINSTDKYLFEVEL